MTDPLGKLQAIRPPAPAPQARANALSRALAEFDAVKKSRAAPQGWERLARLISRGLRTWSTAMTTKSIAGPAFATLLLIPAAGLITWSYIQDQPQLREETRLATGPLVRADEARKQIAKDQADTAGSVLQPYAAPPQDLKSELADQPAQVQPVEQAAKPSADAMLSMEAAEPERMALRGMVDQPAVFAPLPPDIIVTVEEDRERVQQFDSNPVKRVAQEPVSTFSIDADTASYAMVRRSLREGAMPAPDSVRVEEMINYFDYAWPAPTDAATPFKASVTVMPTPWNANTRLMHVAIKGYQIEQVQKPKTNLVFLVDTSGSMQDGDKLPLVKASLRMLLDKLSPDDTVGLVAYAGEAGVVLEPTKASERRKILAAIEQLGAGGSTAGAAGIEEAYRLAQDAFIDGGVNRVMLATDGDFNVGPSDDEALKRLVEAKRKSGVFLSVLGFGQGNYNDQLMQVIAQNGNGTAAYIDTLSEAEKTLVQEAGSTLFPIAKDVKIQVEFNPAVISEYRLIGYETRALNREDFNNDKVDAGEIGSGHAVSAIYELTPVGSAALSVDALRYGKPQSADAVPASSNGEIGFVKIRYKLPNGATSTLISQPVNAQNGVEGFAAAPDDVRFSVAVAAFGQKLRQGDAVSGYGYDAIAELAASARGSDPFGYRAEFLTLVRLAKGLDTNR